jgi:hypothetical protein
MGRPVAPSARRTTRKHASGFSWSPRSIEDANKKDFAEEGRPVEIRQSSRLSTPDRPEQGGDKFDVLPLYKSNQISDDGARLIRVVRSVGDNRFAVGARQLESILQMFGVGGALSRRDGLAVLLVTR